MPEEWRKDLVPVYKKKGDIQYYSNYRSIKLTSQALRL